MLQKSVVPVTDSLKVELERLSKQLPKKAIFELYKPGEQRQFQLLRTHLPDLAGFKINPDEVQVADPDPKPAAAGDFAKPIVVSVVPTKGATSLAFSRGPWANVRLAHRLTPQGAILQVGLGKISNAGDRASKFEAVFKALGLDGIVVDRAQDRGFVVTSTHFKIDIKAAQLGGFNPETIEVSGISDAARLVASLQTTDDLGELKRSMTLTKAVYQSAASQPQSEVERYISFFGEAPATSAGLRPCAEFSWKDGKAVQIDEDAGSKQLTLYANFVL